MKTILLQRQIIYSDMPIIMGGVKISRRRGHRPIDPYQILGQHITRHRFISLLKTMGKFFCTFVIYHWKANSLYYFSQSLLPWLIYLAWSSHGFKWIQHFERTHWITSYFSSQISIIYIPNGFNMGHKWFITYFCGHFTYIETLWKVMKWSMKWPYSIQWGPVEMFCSRHTFFCDHIW